MQWQFHLSDWPTFNRLLTSLKDKMWGNGLSHVRGGRWDVTAFRQYPSILQTHTASDPTMPSPAL